MKKINIIGAGLTGPLLSIYLSKKGFDVSLYEKRSDCRLSSNYNGRSINLALSERGINALKEISLYDSIKDLLIPMSGRMIHRVGENLDFQAYGSNENQCIYSVSRLELNKKLLDLSESCGVEINFNKVLTGYDLDSNTLDFNGGMIKDSSPVIGCDGYSSIISDVIATYHGRAKRIEGLGYSYKELNVLPSDEGFQLDGRALHIWPRNSFMMIALPNTDKSFTCTLFLPNSGTNSFNENTNNGDVTRFFKNNFPDLIPLMPDYVDQYIANPVSTLSTIYLDMWHYKDRACVLGDAAHAIVPFFGQGMNAGFEDCSVLNKLLNNFNGNWDDLFSDFHRLRKKNCDAIARMALENFIEMRDHVLDKKYIMKKRLSSIIESRYKDRFIPRYSMVSFYNIPYSKVYERGRVQDKILDSLISKGCDVENIDFQLIDRMIKENLEPIYE